MPRRLAVATIVVAALLAAAVVALFLRVNANEVAVAPGTPPPPVTTPPTIVPTATAVPTTAPPTATPTATATATPTTTATPVDGDVASYQRVLADLGYYVGDLDGEAGPATRSAIVAFQKVHGLAADGEVGTADARGAGGSAAAVPARRRGDARRDRPDAPGALPGRGRRPDTHRPGELRQRRVVHDGVGWLRALAHAGRQLHRRAQDRGRARGAPRHALRPDVLPSWLGGPRLELRAVLPGQPRVRARTRADAQWLFDRAPVGMPVQLYGGDHVFSPAEGETAGTDTPAGDTPDTMVPDAISTDEPTAEPTASPTPTPTPSPTPSPAPSPTPAPPPTPTPSPTPTPTPTTPPPAPPPRPHRHRARPGPPHPHPIPPGRRPGPRVSSEISWSFGRVKAAKAGFEEGHGR